ncbi:hypothetical protein DFJ74DRAFT_713092 [Hyaloraphidium curvatum]|nr:hypothetical protein DFJ74DRAFT_713092 [Hyaloraphidium curvatum]
MAVPAPLLRSAARVFARRWQSGAPPPPPAPAVSPLPPVRPPPTPWGGRAPTFASAAPPPGHKQQKIVLPEPAFREWRIDTAGARVRISKAYRRGSLLYDTPTSHPKIVLPHVQLNHAEALYKTDDLPAVPVPGGLAIPAPVAMPLGALAVVMKEELGVDQVELWDCVAFDEPADGVGGAKSEVEDASAGNYHPDAPRTDGDAALPLKTLRPGTRWSNFAALGDVFTEAMQGFSQGFFIAHPEPGAPAEQPWRVTYIKVPSLPERLAPALAILLPLRERLSVLDARKAELDAHSSVAAHRALVAAFSALCSYTVVVGYLVFIGSDWDTMEPITFYVGLCFAVAVSGFYLATHRAFSYETLHSMAHERRMARLYREKGFDLEDWKRTKAEVEAWDAWMAAVKRSYN